MADTCPDCGLPRELCVCVAMGIKDQQITVYLDKRSYGKNVTIVEGVDDKNAKELVKMLKSKLACGGTYKNDEIELQGDHRKRVKEILVKEGFPAGIIEVR